MAASISRASRRLIVGAAVVALLGVLVVPVRSLWSVYRDITEECEWTAADSARLEAVPLDAFVGHDVEMWGPHCSVSTPDRIHAWAELSDSQQLPGEWKERHSVAGWTLAREVSGFSGPVLCYTSADDRWTDVEVRLWSYGLVDASIMRGRTPCE